MNDQVSVFTTLVQVTVGMGSPEAMHFMDTVSPFFATIKPFLGVLEISGGALAKDKLTNVVRARRRNKTSIV